MFLWISVMMGVVFLDQLSKYLTVLYIDFQEQVPVIEGVFGLTYFKNTGAAFSMFDEPDQRWIFMSISTVALLGLALYLFCPRPRALSERWKWLPARPRDKWVCLSLSFILGGGIGNMIDRFALKYVVDMIEVYFIDFAIFNVADSFVCVGAGLLMLIMILDIIKEFRAERAARVTADGEVADTDEESPEAADSTADAAADEDACDE